MIGLIILLTFLSLIILSFTVIIENRLPHSIILFMGFGLGCTILYFLFSAPDVALTEAVIGAGLSSVILLITIMQTKRVK